MSARHLHLPGRRSLPGRAARARLRADADPAQLPPLRTGAVLRRQPRHASPAEGPNRPGKRTHTADPELTDGVVARGGCLTASPIPVDRRVVGARAGWLRRLLRGLPWLAGRRSPPRLRAKWSCGKPPSLLEEHGHGPFPRSDLSRVISPRVRLMPPSYAAELLVSDRWAIVAYLRALALSQAAELSRASPGDVRASGPRRRSLR